MTVSKPTYQSISTYKVKGTHSVRRIQLFGGKTKKNSYYHPYLGHLSISQKKCAIKSMLILISMRKTESPCERKKFVTFGTSEKMEVKRGHFVKKWEFGQRKKNIYQFFKIRIYAFMTYGQFPLKSSSNLRFVIRDSRVRGLQPCHRKRLGPLNLGWQI